MFISCFLCSSLESYDFNYDEFMELYHALELTPSADLTIDQIKRAHHQLGK